MPENHSLYGLEKLAKQLESDERIACAAVNVVWEPSCCAIPEDPWDGKADWENLNQAASNWGFTAIRAPESW